MEIKIDFCRLNYFMKWREIVNLDEEIEIKLNEEEEEEEAR